MAEKILLISVNTCTTPYPVYPLGISHVAASLRGRGHEVVLADLRYDDGEIENIVENLQPRYIGLSLRNIDDHRIDETVFFVPVLYAIAERLRKISAAPIILGGSAYSLFPEELIEKSGADYGVVGEGDATLPHLIDMLMHAGAEPADLSTIQGLVYRNGGRIVRNPVAPLNAGTVARPYRPERLFDAYLTHSGVANIQTQRGCPYTCCYCTYPVIEGRTMRARDPAAVADEAAELEANGARYFFIVDSVFNADNDHVVAVCEAFLDRKITATWGCFLRPKAVSTELMELMARAGLRHIEFGTDSLCDRVLDAYGKQFTVDDIVTADNIAHACGVRHAHFLISGGPGETEATLQESFDNSVRLKKTVIFPFVGMRLYPGTVLYGRALKEKVIDETTDLLQPFFYVTGELRKERITEVLDMFHERASRWVVRDPSPEQLKVIERLRARNMSGPLWEFLAQ